MEFKIRHGGLLGAAIWILSVSSPALSHEFWISPHVGQLTAGETITADLKVGLGLKGEPYPYLSDRFRHFDIALGSQRTPVPGLEGDLPALQEIAVQSGLNIIHQQTVPFRAQHDDWAIFRRYLEEEGLSAFEADHQRRGLAKQDFAERYTRYAKALVQVGPVAPAHRDRFTGMTLELVAEANPYEPGLASLPVRLLWLGRPLAHRQINLFNESQGAVRRLHVITDGEGRVTIPLSGAGEYLLNAVQLEAANDPPVVWQSHWATLSFRL